MQSSTHLQLHQNLTPDLEVVHSEFELVIEWLNSTGSDKRQLLSKMCDRTGWSSFKLGSNNTQANAIHIKEDFSVLVPDMSVIIAQHIRR